MRGEQQAARRATLSPQGSPPLARGTDYHNCKSICFYRITPACAGNSGTPGSYQAGKPDHPRLRGEQHSHTFTLYSCGGSPPLARGTAKLSLELLHCTRITPACAGNRDAVYPLWTAAGDHPRLRGEQGDTWAEWPLGVGSPPLARGTDYFFSEFEEFYRITPACAGNSAVVGIADKVTQDHPRLRGEQNCIGGQHWQWIGSPPLARGTARW